MNRIGKLLTGRDAVAEFIDANGLPYVECGGCEKAGKNVPLWQKYTLSIDEAAAYFRIGVNKLRKIIDRINYSIKLLSCSCVNHYVTSPSPSNKLRKIIEENPDADFVLWNRTRAQIKRKKFEEYIDKLNVI